MADLVLERFHGDTFVLPVRLTDSNGSAISLVGASIKFTLSNITEATEGYSIVRNDVAGTFSITVSDDTMETLTAEKYLFSVEVVYAGGIKQTLFVGKLVLKEDVVP